MGANGPAYRVFDTCFTSIYAKITPQLLNHQTFNQLFIH